VEIHQSVSTNLRFCKKWDTAYTSATPWFVSKIRERKGKLWDILVNPKTGKMQIKHQTPEDSCKNPASTGHCHPVGKNDRYRACRQSKFNQNTDQLNTKRLTTTGTQTWSISHMMPHWHWMKHNRKIPSGLADDTTIYWKVLIHAIWTTNQQKKIGKKSGAVSSPT